jgi:hypothetical protein
MSSYQEEEFHEIEETWLYENNCEHTETSEGAGCSEKG